MNCRVCGLNLYKEMDLRQIFKPVYRIHVNCEKHIVVRSKREVIPIERNVIYFDYLYDEKLNLNYDYLFFESMLFCLLQYIENHDWSIMYFYEEEEYNNLSDESKYLLLKLGQKPIVFISMFAY